MLKKNQIILTMAVLLASCSGYSPVYKGYGEGFSHVVIQEVKMVNSFSDTGRGKRRIAQWVYKDLKSDFPKEDGIYHVFVKLSEEERELAITRDATEERNSLTLEAEITLHQEGVGDVLHTTFEVQSHYNVQETPYGTESSMERARRSVASAVAEGIESRLAIFMHKQAQ